MKPRDNPFRTSRTDALTFRGSAGTTAHDLLRRLRTADGRGAIVGPMGTGKSTLMRELAAALTHECRNVVNLGVSWDLPFIVREDFKRLRRTLADDAVCIDGADLLPWRIWWRTRFACRRAKIFIVTSHARPLLPVLYRTNATPQLLIDLTQELLGGAPSLSDRDSRQLLEAHQSNIREALRNLYDRYQDGPAGAEAMDCTPHSKAPSCSVSS